MTGFPRPHVIPPTSQHMHTIILLHGLGSNGDAFAGELFEARTSHGLSLQQHLPGWKWVFPTSQTRYSTVFRQDGTEWFEIHSLTDPTVREETQVDGLQQSVAFINQLIETEANDVPRANIVLGGISQGCATAVRAMLNGQELGAFVGFCSWMPFPSDFKGLHTGSFDANTLVNTMSNRQRPLNLPFAPATAEPSAEQRMTRHSPDHMHSPTLQRPLSPPIFLSHCRDDGMVDFKLGIQLRDILLQLGMEVTWRDYEDSGEWNHWIREPEGFDDLVDFLVATFRLAHLP